MDKRAPTYQADSSIFRQGVGIQEQLGLVLQGLLCVHDAESDGGNPIIELLKKDAHWDEQIVTSFEACRAWKMVDGKLLLLLLLLLVKGVFLGDDEDNLRHEREDSPIQSIRHASYVDALSTSAKYRLREGEQQKSVL